MTNPNWPGRSESPILLPLSFALWICPCKELSKIPLAIKAETVIRLLSLGESCASLDHTLFSAKYRKNIVFAIVLHSLHMIRFFHITVRNHEICLCIIVHMLWVRGFREWQSPELQRISDSFREKLSGILKCITENANVVGFTIAE